jgi:hypothetical protein
MGICVEDDDQERWDRSCNISDRRSRVKAHTDLQSHAHNDLNHLLHSYWWSVMLRDWRGNSKRSSSQRMEAPATTSSFVYR